MSATPIQERQATTANNQGKPEAGPFLDALVEAEDLVLQLAKRFHTAAGSARQAGVPEVDMAFQTARNSLERLARCLRYDAWDAGRRAASRTADSADRTARARARAAELTTTTDLVVSTPGDAAAKARAAASRATTAAREARDALPPCSDDGLTTPAEQYALVVA